MRTAASHACCSCWRAGCRHTCAPAAKTRKGPEKKGPALIWHATRPLARLGWHAARRCGLHAPPAELQPHTSAPSARGDAWRTVFCGALDLGHDRRCHALPRLPRVATRCHGAATRCQPLPRGSCGCNGCHSAATRLPSEASQQRIARRCAVLSSRDDVCTYRRQRSPPRHYRRCCATAGPTRASRCAPTPHARTACVACAAFAAPASTSSALSLIRYSTSVWRSQLGAKGG